ncbi:MAG: (d)CMP kinase [Oscillospiraceae bacterium]|jgi:cytidylate kinase
MGINIAIDGPSGAGKSSIAKRLAKKMDYVHIDTGALYRAIALFVINNGADTCSEEEVSPLLNGIRIDIKHIDDSQHVFLNYLDVTSEIRSPDISMGASNVSAHPLVRAFLLELQREIAGKNNIIMDGRDIGTVVLPDADVKIFLTASPEERATRRFSELERKAVKISYDEVLNDIKQRDFNDSNREIAPLKKADDAILVDTTGNEFEQSVEILHKIIIHELENPRKKSSGERCRICAFRIFLYAILRMVISGIFHIYYNLKIEGKYNIPKTGGNIFASNHRSYTDPILIALPTRVPFAFMAKEELFQGGRLFKWLITAFGAFPVQRGKGDFSAIDESISRLNLGRNLVIFPEGTRSKDGVVGRGKTGVALIAAKAQVKVIPVGISFKGSKLKFRSRIKVKFGKPIDPEELTIKSTAASDLKLLKHKIMSAITELVELNVNKM